MLCRNRECCFLMLASMTLAWAGQAAQSDGKAQPCKVTTKAGSHPCTAAEEAGIAAKQRHALEGYQAHASGQPYTKEEQGRALRLRLLGPEASPAAGPSAMSIRLDRRPRNWSVLCTMRRRRLATPEKQAFETVTQGRTATRRRGLDGAKITV